MQKQSSKAKGRRRFTWNVELGIRKNAARLGKALAKAHPHLYRSEQGLIEALPDQSRVRVIDKAKALSPILIDHLHVRMMRNGHIVGELPQVRHLDALLCAEQFLRHFKAS